jgi:hypothetical protein
MSSIAPSHCSVESSLNNVIPPSATALCLPGKLHCALRLLADLTELPQLSLTLSRDIIGKCH